MCVVVQLFCLYLFYYEHVCEYAYEHVYEHNSNNADETGRAA